jgi:hypothetical protein
MTAPLLRPAAGARLHYRSPKTVHMRLPARLGHRRRRVARARCVKFACQPAPAPATAARPARHAMMACPDDACCASAAGINATQRLDGPATGVVDGTPAPVPFRAQGRAQKTALSGVLAQHDPPHRPARRSSALPACPPQPSWRMRRRMSAIFRSRHRAAWATGHRHMIASAAWAPSRMLLDPAHHVAEQRIGRIASSAVLLRGHVGHDSRTGRRAETISGLRSSLAAILGCERGRYSFGPTVRGGGWSALLAVAVIDVIRTTTAVRSRSGACSGA